MTESSLNVVPNKSTSQEDNELSIQQTLATVNDENEERISEIPLEANAEKIIFEITSDENREEISEYYLEENVEEEKETKEVNLEDEDPATEFILEPETTPDPDFVSTTDSSAMYYSQSYEGSQQTDLDRLLEREATDFEEQTIPEEEENEEEEEIEIDELNLDSEPQEESDKDEWMDEYRKSMRTSLALPTTEREFPSYEQEMQDKGESDTDESDALNPITVTPGVELEDDKEEEFEFPTEYETEIEKEEVRSAERVYSICEDLGPILYIKVVIEGQEVLRTSFGINSLIPNVKIRLAPIFHLKPNEIDLFCEECICQDDDKLAHFGVDPPNTLTLQVKAKDPNHDILSYDYLHYAPLIDIISHRIPLTGNYFEDKLMHIESDCFVKEWLGGFKNKKTNREYHTAQTQTLPRIYNLPRGVLPPSFSRQSQTPVFPLVDEGTSSSESKGTQVWRTDYYVSNCSDKIIMANPKRFVQRRSEKPIIHLTMVVHALMVFKRFMKKIEKKMCKAAMVCLSLPRLEVGDQKLKDEMVREVQRKMRINMFFPTTRFDFSMLYLLVSKWRHNEKRLIDKFKTKESRKAAYYLLSQKEVDMIWMIEKQRLSVKKEALKRNNQEFIEKAARPKNTKNFNSFDSLETQQAREYLEIYSTLTRRDVTKEQRLDILHHFRNIILSISPEEGVDKLIQLVDRECDLLQIGLKRSQLEVLRLRIEQHTLECLHSNLVQPDPKTAYKERKLKKLVQAKFRCSRCRLLKPCSDYNVHLKVTKFSICYSCEWLMHIGYQRLDLSPYLRILESVRKSEMALNTNSGASYILQVTGMYFLVNSIWLGKSALSENSDVSNLRMVRWRQNEDWTPWNCILLTQDEARIHMDIPDVDEYYDKPFLNSVFLKHKRARYHFFLLFISDMYIKKTGLWYNVI